MLGLNMSLWSAATGRVGAPAYAGHNMVAFDGGDCLYQSAALFPDAAYGTIAIKFRPTSVGTPVTQNLIHFGAANRRLTISNADLAYTGVFGATTTSNIDITGATALANDTDYTLQISWDGALDVVTCTVNGIQQSTGGWTVPGAQLLLTNATQLGIGGTGAGVVTNGFIGQMGFVLIAAGATSAFNINPALIYNGGDVDLSNIGVTPQIFFGGTQVETDWNAGTNQGSAGGTFTMVGDVAV